MTQLINDVQTKVAVLTARSSGSDELALRSYYLTEYQREMLDELAHIHKISKAAVLRLIIDEWYLMKMSER